MAITNRDETEQSPRRRPKRSRGEPKLYISFLPEGRGGPREDKGSVPLEIDVEAHIEERTDCEPGLYRIEKKRSGEFSGEVLFYSKDDVSDFEAPAAIGGFADDAGRPESSEADVRRIVAATVSATLEARERRERGQLEPMEQFRQMRELLKEEREEMQRQLASSSGQQQDPLAMFERVIELHKKLQPEASEPEDALTAKDRAQLMLVKESGIIPEFMRSMREMLRAPEQATEPKGFVEKALDYVTGWTPYIGPVLAPVLGGKVAELLSRVDVNVIAQRMAGQHASQVPAGPPPGAVPPSAQQPETAASVSPSSASGTQAQSPPQPTAEDLVTMEAFDVVVREMRLYDEEPDDAALNAAHLRIAADALQKLPSPLLQQIVAVPAALLVVNLSQLHPAWADVAELIHAAGFISDLKLKVVQRLEEKPAVGSSVDSGYVSDGPDEAAAVTEVPAVAPNANGAKPAASVGS